MRELNLPKTEFYIGVGLILGYRIDEYVEGKKRYYYLSDMVREYREKIINNTRNK